MTHKQEPLGRGVTGVSTVHDFLRHVDLADHIIIVTADHAELGAVVARALARAGASVTVAARDPDRAERALRGLARAEIDQVDFLDPTSIDAFAERWLDTWRPPYVLINNPGLPAPAGRVRNGRGYEAQFATNYHGHLQLTCALQLALRAARGARGARVVNVPSGAHRSADIRWDDINFDKGYDPGAACAQSMTAAVLFAVELDRRWAHESIHGYAVHPGVVVGTSLNSAVGEESLTAVRLIDESRQPIIHPEIGKKHVSRGQHHRVRGR